MARAYKSPICDGCFWAPYLVFVLLNVSLVSVAAGMVCFFALTAKGSGIPEIKGYLNGIKMADVLRIRTLLVKVSGVICAVSGGLAVGKEGPMIHTGCVIAGGLSQGKSTTFPFFNTRLLGEFRNDTEKRDFVSEGVAAGVAAAFGAPIGGVLLSLEEGSSFWNQQLTWRTFFCAMVSTFTTNFFLSGIGGHWGALSNPGLIDFGDFSKQENGGYELQTLPLFACIGIGGGLIGALFNSINKKLQIFRQRYINISPTRQFAEALLLAAFTATCAFTLSYFVHECRKIDSQTTVADVNHYEYFCPQGYYNDMAAVFCNTQELSINNLFHDVEGSAFSVPTLIVYSFAYYFLIILGCGISVPAALFVPGLLLGAAYGRLVGIGIQYLFPDWPVNLGTFALIGSAGMLGGIVRMTISLTVILMEATGDLVYGLPLMLTLIFAKGTGDLFNHGVYDMHIQIQHIPLLEWESPLLMRKFLARHVMASDVICFDQVEKVDKVYTTLLETKHNGFPILGRNGNIVGLMLRSQLITLLKKKSFQTSNQLKGEKYYHKVQVDDFMEDYPRYPPITTVELTEKQKGKYMDMTPYMNKNPYTIFEEATLTRVFRIFRTMGLRHLVVIDYDCKVIGIITRHDLANYEDRVRKRKEEHSRVGMTINEKVQNTESENEREQRSYLLRNKSAY